jgi:hypothetical protein
LGLLDVEFFLNPFIVLFFLFFLFSLLLLFLEDGIVVGYPIFLVFELALFDILFNNPVVLSVETLEVEEVKNVVDLIVVLLRVCFEALILEVDIEPFQTTNVAIRLFILGNVYTFLPEFRELVDDGT